MFIDPDARSPFQRTSNIGFRCVKYIDPGSIPKEAAEAVPFLGPEVDIINFLPRVKQPVLMLNGHYDFFFPENSNQEVFYRLLGSRKDQKKHLIYETGHSIPRNELIKETLNWLDEYLGPVR